MDESIARALGYRDIISKSAELYRLPLLTMLALAVKESGCIPDKFNELTMATGLFQVLPRERGKLFEHRPNIEQLKNPEINADWAGAILSNECSYEGNSLRWGTFAWTGGVSYWLEYAHRQTVELLHYYPYMSKYRPTVLAFEQFERRYWADLRRIMLEILHA